MSQNIPVRFASFPAHFWPCRRRVADHLLTSLLTSPHPQRRITRATRTTLKDENANARPRTTTRSKPPSASTTTIDKPAVGTRAATNGAASRARALAAKEAQLAEQDPAAGKRKRSAFGEVGGPNQPKVKPPSVAGAKGKGKAEPTQPIAAPSKVLVKSSKTTTTTAAAAAPRVPLRTVVAPTGTKRVTRAATATEQQHQQRLPDVKEEPEVVPRRLKHHTYAAPTAIPVPTRRSVANPRTTVTTTTTVVKTAPTRRPLTSRTVKQERVQEDDDEEADRVYKKRRTSSEAPEEHHHQVEARSSVTQIVDEEAAIRAEQEAVAELSMHVEQIQREEEADPFGDEWQDLDAEDAQDPLMVSEYVNEIFEYLKEVEVSIPLSSFVFAFSSSTILANDDAERTLHGQPERPGMEDAWHPHRLAHPSPHALPSSPRDPLPGCQHH